MKKIFFLAAAMVAALAVNAEETPKTIAELCNFIDFQDEYVAHHVAPDTLPGKGIITSVESTWYTTVNGSVIKGYKKSDESEAEVSFNVKTEYNTTVALYDGTTFVDSLTAGTMLRAGSGVSVELAEFKVGENAAIEVYYQPNGDSDRGVSIAVSGGDPVEFKGSGKKN